MKAQFLLGKPQINVCKHFKDRLKNRLHIKKEKTRKRFVKKLAAESLTIYDIPSFFAEFYSYMYKKLKMIQRKNLYTFLVLFENWFIVTSCDGCLITIFEIEERFKNIYFDIINYKEDNSFVKSGPIKEKIVKEQDDSLEEINIMDITV